MVFNFNYINKIKNNIPQDKIQESKPLENDISETLNYSGNEEYEYFRAQYKLGKIPKLNKDEMSLLEFCHNTDMRAFLKEEFTKHPINSADADGGILGICGY